MGKFDTAPRITKRSLTLEEARRLLAIASPDARILYLVALTTGLRRGELMQLKVSDLNHDTGGLNIRREISKNRLPSMQPLPQSIYEALKESAQGKDPAAPLLAVPSHTTPHFRQDLKRAGIPKWTPEGKLDFHSLRNAYITLILESGANAKEAQPLVRHSTANLTLNTYARTRPKRLSELVESVWNSTISSPGYITEPQREVMVMGNKPELIDNQRTIMVEAPGIEPGSEDLPPSAPTRVFRERFLGR